MTPDLSGADCLAGDGSGGANLHAVRGDREKREMTDEELGEMSLESLLYYVLVGEGRRSL
jgi:hypothetical protein